MTSAVKMVHVTKPLRGAYVRKKELHISMGLINENREILFLIFLFVWLKKENLVPDKKNLEKLINWTLIFMFEVGLDKQGAVEESLLSLAF